MFETAKTGFWALTIGIMSIAAVGCDGGGDVHFVTDELTLPVPGFPLWEAEFEIEGVPRADGEGPTVAVLYYREVLTGRFLVEVNDELVIDVGQEPAWVEHPTVGLYSMQSCALFRTPVRALIQPRQADFEDYFDRETHALIAARLESGYKWVLGRVPWRALQEGTNTVRMSASSWTDERVGPASVALVVVSDQLTEAVGEVAVGPPATSCAR